MLVFSLNLKTGRQTDSRDRHFVPQIGQGWINKGMGNFSNKNKANC